MKDKPRKHLSGENGFIEGVLDKKEFDPESKGNNTSSQLTAGREGVSDGVFVAESFLAYSLGFITGLILGYLIFQLVILIHRLLLVL